MEDKKIVDLFWMRSEQAITETATKYGKYCHSIAYNILANNEDAEEAVNDTYMGAWNSIPPHRPSILRTFLGKITRRISLKKYRDQNRDKRGGGEVALVLEELDECVASPVTVEGEIMAKELGKALNRFVSELPDIERKVFMCRYWFMDSIDTISRDFDFSNSKTKSMLYRTRMNLLAYLREEGLE